MLRTTGLVLAMTAIALADGPGTNHGQRKQVTLWAAISTPEPVVEVSNTENLQINFGVVNDGHSTINPRLGLSRLMINGVELQDWSFIVGNGPRDSSFEALPPGHAVRFGYAMGKFFQKPGIYTVRWAGANFRAPDLTFRVIPNVR